MVKLTGQERAQKQRVLKNKRRVLLQLEADPQSGTKVMLDEIAKLRDEIAQVEKELQEDVAIEENKVAPVHVNDDQQQVAPAPARPIQQITVDFTVQGATAKLTWRTPLFGRQDSTFTMPYDDVELPLVIRALDVVQYPSYPNAQNDEEARLFSFTLEEQELLESLNLWHDSRVVKKIYHSVGSDLFFQLGDTGQLVLKGLRNNAIDQNRRLSYVLRFPANAVSLAALPWEMVWDRQNGRPALIRGDELDSCERYVDIEEGIPQPRVAGEQLQILALVPKYGIPDDLRQREQQERVKIWNKLGAKVKFDQIELPLTMRALNEYLDGIDPVKPDIIHYFGHGTYQVDETGKGTGYLLFDDDKGGKEMVSAERLATALNGARLVVIHACQSAMVNSGGGLLTGLAPMLSLVTGAVVAMQLTVRTEAALLFADVFYRELLSKGRSLQDAVAMARKALFVVEADSTSWFVPTLYIRSRDPGPVYLV